MPPALRSTLCGRRSYTSNHHVGSCFNACADPCCLRTAPGLPAARGLRGPSVGAAEGGGVWGAVVAGHARGSRRSGSVAVVAEWADRGGAPETRREPQGPVRSGGRAGRPPGLEGHLGPPAVRSDRRALRSGRPVAVGVPELPACEQKPQAADRTAVTLKLHWNLTGGHRTEVPQTDQPCCSTWLSGRGGPGGAGNPPLQESRAQRQGALAGAALEELGTRRCRRAVRSGREPRPERPWRSWEPAAAGEPCAAAGSPGRSGPGGAGNPPLAAGEPCAVAGSPSRSSPGGAGNPPLQESRAQCQEPRHQPFLS
ncbi:collagen, type I, alpha 1b-like [Saccopteryx bilineata]|uniref:collagen, type I, alpha 1b-like n=1 Tax=Saccopteryx bilineata TaxID=59482 RepID=UPI00338E3908